MHLARRCYCCGPSSKDRHPAEVTAAQEARGKLLRRLPRVHCSSEASSLTHCCWPRARSPTSFMRAKFVCRHCRRLQHCRQDTARVLFQMGQTMQRVESASQTACIAHWRRLCVLLVSCLWQVAADVVRGEAGVAAAACRDCSCNKCGANLSLLGRVQQPQCWAHCQQGAAYSALSCQLLLLLPASGASSAWRICILVAGHLASILPCMSSR